MSAPRVVFIPGVMGSNLIDTSLTPAQARAACESNLGALGRLLRGSALYPCDKRPELLWGGVGSLHWLFNPAAWETRIKSGNGLDQPGAVRADGVFAVDVRFRGKPLRFMPYAAFVRALQRAGADVLVFPYDWRLACHLSVDLLRRRILERWFGGRLPEPGRVPSPAERITFIGHSMGGLVARYFLESHHLGHSIARRLITIGTPHLGSPQAYLHFMGVTFPFPDNPFYRSAHEVLRLQMAQAAITPQGEFAAQFLPKKTQTAVFRHMASAIQLMPVYGFAVKNGRRESYQTTYRDLRHAGTGMPALEVMAKLRGHPHGVVPEPRLDAWLQGHKMHYHLLAATGFATASGFDRDRRRVLTTRDGDGTVPVASATVVARSTGNMHVVRLAAHRFAHQRLCERDDVQAYCLRMIGRRRVRPQPPGVTVAAAQTGPTHAVPQQEKYLAAAKWILRKVSRQRGVVLSIVRLQSRDARPLIDIETEPSPSPKRRRLKNPPKHLSSPEIYPVEAAGLTSLKFVWMLSNEKAAFPVGGMLFIPDPGELEVHLVTFNGGQLDTRDAARCSHQHHAEMQLVRWIVEQPRTWQARIRTIEIANRSRSPRLGGYSPCTPCCVVLSSFLSSLHALPKPTPPARVGAVISWFDVYKNGAVCGHPTTEDNLRRLEASGWTLERRGRRAPAPRRRAPVPARAP
jgi:pimeloyl-ACP methyl ester carboxylesterase